MSRPTREVDRERLLRRARLATWRNRLGLVAVAGLLVGAIGVAVYARGLLQQMRSPTCEAWAPVDLSIDELIQLKRRKEAYQNSADPTAALSVDGPQATALLRETVAFDVRLLVVDDLVDATLVARWDEDDCYNVHYVGHLEVRDGVAFATPENLFIGEIDWSGWVHGWRFEIGPDRVRDPAVAKALTNTEKLKVDGGQITFRLYDPWALW